MKFDFLLGYNSNGFAHHDIVDTIKILHDLGYNGIGITIDHCCLNPYKPDFEKELAKVKDILNSLGLYSVIETGARYLLDPWKKHNPTLIDPDPSLRRKRFEFLKKSLEIADFLGACALSFWSGAKAETTPENQAFQWLIEGCRELARLAEEVRIPLAFEPEPGMLVDNLEKFAYLKENVDSPYFQLTFDIGHIHLSEKQDVDRCFKEFMDIIRNVHLEDMTKKCHEHLFFGDGDIDFGAFFKAVRQTNYKGPIVIELSRHSYNAVEVARDSMKFIANVTNSA